jgi:tRNA(Ile)-lysidine synthase
LTTIVRRATRELALGGETTVLVAVSGGPDSMALLHVLAMLRAKGGPRVVAHGVDHGLRHEAAAELDLAATIARDLGVAFGATRVEVGRGPNVQARARTARYGALRDAAGRAGASFVATAHHADDRAETVLLRILSGAGARGLGVLPPRAGDLIRPMIRATRADVLAHISRHCLAHALDPSNEDPRFTRARIRRDLVPLLRALDPRIVDHLCQIADDLAGPPRDASFPLPRPVEEALAALAASRDPRARVSLPGGLVAVADATHHRGRHAKCKV